EKYTHQVKGLTFVPICRAPYLSDRRKFGQRCRVTAVLQLNTQSELQLVRYRSEVVDYSKSLFGMIIYCSNIGQKIEIIFGMIAQPRTDIHQQGGIQLKRRL